MKDIIVPLFLLLMAGLMYAVNERVTALAHEVEKVKMVQIGQAKLLAELRAE